MSVYPQIADNEQLISIQEAARLKGLEVRAAHEMRVGLPIRHRLELLRNGAAIMTWMTDDRRGLRRAFSELRDHINEMPICPVKSQ